MTVDRRTFLQRALVFLAGNFARRLGLGAGAAVATGAAAAVAPVGAYGSAVRAQVFEVIVRQGLAGAPWQEICAGPMKVNAISEEEVTAEINRRRDLPCQQTSTCKCSTCSNLRAARLTKAYGRPCEKTVDCQCATCIIRRWREADLV